MRHNRLMALLASNRARPKRYEVLQAADATEATVYLYDLIDSYFGIGAEQFVKDLNAITAPVIHLRINSPGGDIFEARAIATAVAQHPSEVVAHIDGLAASAASYIATSADRVEMAPGAFVMIHNAWTFCIGNAEDLLTTAALLEKIDGSLAEDYAKATGASVEKIKAMMDAETWLTDQEAVDEGFADLITPDGEDTKASASWDLSAYGAKAPRMAAAPAETILTPSSPSGESADALDLAHADRRRRFALVEKFA